MEESPRTSVGATQFHWKRVAPTVVRSEFCHLARSPRTIVGVRSTEGNPAHILSQATPTLVRTSRIEWKNPPGQVSVPPTRLSCVTKWDPGGVKSCSQGREALDENRLRIQAPEGRHRTSCKVTMSPLRGFDRFALGYQGLTALASRLCPSGTSGSRRQIGRRPQSAKGDMVNFGGLPNPLLGTE
jgi:hypothetical protein